MKRMNFPGRKSKRRAEAEERAKHVKPENTKRYRKELLNGAKKVKS